MLSLQYREYVSGSKQRTQKEGHLFKVKVLWKWQYLYVISLKASLCMRILFLGRSLFCHHEYSNKKCSCDISLWGIELLNNSFQGIILIR